MPRILLLVFLLLIGNAFLWLFLDRGSTEALLTIGDPSGIALFEKNAVLSNPGLGTDVPKVDQYGRLSLFLAILGIQATMLGFFFVPGTRLIFPINFGAGAKNKSNILCVGLGGTGKTTLIENSLMDNDSDPSTSLKFEVYSTTRHVRNALTNLTVFDPVGQDWADLVKQVLNLERNNGVIDHLVVVIGIAETVKDGAEWSLNVPDKLSDLASGSMVVDQKNMLREEVLGPVIYNLGALKRVTVLFNQIDIFSKPQPDRFMIDLELVRETYSSCFASIVGEIKKIVGTYDDRKNQNSPQRRKFWNNSDRHSRVELKFHYCSAKWGVALDVKNGIFQPLTRSMLS